MAAFAPDNHSRGFIDSVPDPKRYENVSPDRASVASLLVEVIPPNSRVLDVGCGTGSLTQFIVKRTGAIVVAVEPDSARAALARQRGVHVLERILGTDIGSDYEPFDVVLFADVLEHLPDPAAVVLVARTLLKQGGSIVASVPNIAHWSVRQDLVRGHFDYKDCGIMDATHLRWFTRATVMRFFERLGFDVVAVRHTANVDLPEYANRQPWRTIPRRIRNPLIRLLTRWFPSLFACQHIVRVTPKDP